MPGETKPPHKKPHGRLANGYFRAYTIFTMSTTHEAAKKWVEEIAQLCQPDSIYWCNGSQEENDELCNMMVEKGTFIKLNPEKRPGFLRENGGKWPKRRKRGICICEF